MDKLITYNREMIKTLQNRLLHLLELRTGKFSFDFCDQNFANLEPLLCSSFVVPWHANLSLNHLQVSECHTRSFRSCFCPIIRILGSSSFYCFKPALAFGSIKAQISSFFWSFQFCYLYHHFVIKFDLRPLHICSREKIFLIRPWPWQI